ncbi:hypothetical protein IAE35_05520 [Pseudomonas sp. S75]|uniref:hypothetical protein n=1 Tax=unclassified Pseudomonas TaxID=196821 RepID=UPI001908041F|nr:MULTISPECIES: hypothetical protein [unclassified Pseudomonas]MBJ9975235.1 hypothetical protein [Pseudomonas sp. S30]MBK0152791.1 hypothetical protein [Pseudomonas sp. S75]
MALLAKSSSLIDRQTARALTLLVPASLMALLMAKLFVVALRVVFDAIMNFHERHNTPENAARLRGLGVRYGAGLWVFVRCLAALGSVLMFYGIWFGTSV